MTNKTVGIEFEISGLQRTDEGIDKITGSLTGLEKLTKGFDSAGIKKLSTAVADMTKGLSGLRGDLAGLSSTMGKASTDMATAADRIATSLERMGRGGAVAARAARETQQATTDVAKATKASAAVTEASLKQQEEAHERYLHKVKLATAKLNEVEADRQRKSLSRTQRKIDSADHKLLVTAQESPEKYLKTLENMQRELNTGRIRGNMAIREKFGSLGFELASNRKVLEAEIQRVQGVVASISADKLQNTKAVQNDLAGFAEMQRRRTDHITKAFKAEQKVKQQALQDSLAGDAHIDALRSAAQKKAMEDDLQGFSEMQRLRVKSLVDAQRSAQTQLAQNQNIRLNSAKASGAAAVQQFDAENRAGAAFSYQQAYEPQQFVKRLLRAKSDFEAVTDKGIRRFTDEQVAAKFGNQMLPLLRDTQAFSDAMAVATNRVREVKEATKAAREETKLLKQQQATDSSVRAANARYVASGVSPQARLGLMQRANAVYQSGNLSEEEFDKKFGSRLRAMVSSPAQYSAELAKVQQAVADAESAHLRLGKTGHDVFRGLTSGIGMIWLSWGQILPMLSGFAMSAGVRAMLQVGTQAEHQMKVIGALSQETSGAIRGAEQQLLNMSTSSMFSLNEMIGGLKALTQAGFSTSEALKNVKTVMNLSLLGEVSPEQSALFLAGLRNTFKNDPTVQDTNGQVDLSQAANITAIAAARSQTSISEMMESMKQASSVAEVYGLRLTDVSVALQLLAERNITGSAAGTAVRNAMEDLTGRTKKAREALKQLGVSLYDLNTGATRNPFDVMFDIREKLSGFSDFKRNRFIQSFTDERGKKLIESFMAKSDGEIRTMQAQTFRANENGGFVTRGADDINTGLQALTGQTLSTFRKSAKEVFDDVNPGLKELMGNFKQLAGSSELKTTLTTIAQGMLLTARAATTLIQAAVAAGPALAGAFAGYTLLASVRAVHQAILGAGLAAGMLGKGSLLSNLFPRMAAGLSALLTPWGLLTAAVVTAGGALAYFSTRSETAVSKLADAKQRLAEVTGSLARIRSDRYAEFNQSDNGQESASDNIDKALAQKLNRIASQQSALENLKAVTEEFYARRKSLGDSATEDSLERQMFVAERERSTLRQQLDEFNQYLTTKQVGERDYRDARNKFIDAAMGAERSLFDLEVRLSEQRIQQTRDEVAERSREYMGLAGLMMSKKDTATLATPFDYVNEYAGSDYRASVSRLKDLEKDQVAGKSIQTDLAALTAQLRQNRDRANEVAQDKTLYLEARNRAAGFVKAFDDLISAVTTSAAGGKSVQALSIKNLLDREQKARQSRLETPVKTKSTDMANTPGDESGHHNRKDLSAIFALVDEMTGEDKGVSKLKQILTAKAGSDEYTQLEKGYAELKKNGGAGAAFAESVKNFEGFRKKLLEFVDTEKTFEAKLERSMSTTIKGVDEETKRLRENPVPAGASDSVKKLVDARNAKLKEFDQSRIKQLEGIRTEEGKAKVEAAYREGLKRLDKSLEDYSLALIASMREEGLRALGQQNRKDIEQKSNEVSDKLYELDRPLDLFKNYLESLNLATSDLIRSWKDTDFSSLGSVGRVTAQTFGTVGGAEMRLDDTLSGLDRKRQQQLTAARREAEDKFGTAGLVAGSTEYSKMLEAQQDYIDTRTAAVNEMYQMEIDLARNSYDRQISFAHQYQKSFTDYYKQMQTPAETFGATMTKGLGQLQEAFYGVARGANISFKDIKGGFRELAKDMIAQMIATKMMQATLGVVSTVVGVVGSSIGSAVGSYFSGGVQAAGAIEGGMQLATPNADTSAIFDRYYPQGVAGFNATGGSVSAGKPYVVGEQGWEVFVPNSDGRIIPNQVARNAAGASGDVIYNVNVVINDNSTHESTSGNTTQANADPAGQLGQQIKAKVMEVLLEQKRAGGVLSR